MKKYNQMYVGSVIERMLGSEEAMDEFHEQYLEARNKNTRNTKAPTGFEISVAKSFLEKGATLTAKSHNITVNKVQSIVTFVSRWQFRTGNRI